jgi:hypothetical protein
MKNVCDHLTPFGKDQSSASTRIWAATLRASADSE